jgi:hypothetical protein
MPEIVVGGSLAPSVPRFPGLPVIVKPKALRSRPGEAMIGKAEGLSDMSEASYNPQLRGVKPIKKYLLVY